MADLGLTGVLGDVVAGAVTSAGFGALTGGAMAGITGGDILKGAETGALTGAATGGLLGGLGVTSLASDAASSAATRASAAAGAADPTGGYVGTTTADTGVAADGVAGSTGTASTTASTAGTVAAPTGASATVASNGVGSNGAGGLLTQAPGATPYTPTNTPNVASSGTAGTSTPAVGSLPSVTTPGNTYVGQNGLTYTSNGSSWVAPAASGGLMSNMFGSGGMLGNGGAGYLLSGLGQGLMSGSDIADKAGYDASAATATRNATASNYGSTQTLNADGTAATPTQVGGVLGKAAPNTGLPTPAQAFNPSARWQFDPVSKKLVLVAAPGTGA